MDWRLLMPKEKKKSINLDNLENDPDVLSWAKDKPVKRNVNARDKYHNIDGVMVKETEITEFEWRGED